MRSNVICAQLRKRELPLICFADHLMLAKFYLARLNGRNLCAPKVGKILSSTKVWQNFTLPAKSLRNLLWR